MIQLLDDQLLGSILRGGAPPNPGRPTCTTGYWYVRLCHAVAGSIDRTGALSAPFAALPAGQRDRALRAVLDLPEPIGLVSLRHLAPLMGQLRRRHQLNILSMEVLAAAIHLEADVYLSAPSPRLEAALRAEHRDVELVR